MAAMDVAGGPAFFKGSVIERAYRDIRAAKFHPLTPDASEANKKARDEAWQRWKALLAKI